MDYLFAFYSEELHSRTTEPDFNLIGIFTLDRIFSVVDDYIGRESSSPRDFEDSCISVNDGKNLIRIPSLEEFMEYLGKHLQMIAFQESKGVQVPKAFLAECNFKFVIDPEYKGINYFDNHMGRFVVKMIHINDSGFEFSGQHFKKSNLFSWIKHSRDMKTFNHDAVPLFDPSVMQSKNPKAPIYLFCYGSNNKKQLEERLGRKVEVVPAFAEGFKRVFVGHSEKWDGAVASLKKSQGRSTYGLCAIVYPSDLELMDQYEGKKYKRTKIKASVGAENPKKVNAIAYIASGLPEGTPSKKYLIACAKTVSEFWTSPEGEKITWRDFQ